MPASVKIGAGITARAGLIHMLAASAVDLDRGADGCAGVLDREGSVSSCPW